MAFAMKISVLFLLLAIVFGKTNGTSYRIGDSAGWTNHGVDYKSWSASKVFNVGDVFVFQYNNLFHNVVRVTHKNFRACNASSPYKTFNSGYDTFTVKRPGHYFFICGFGDHCRDGQRVDIRVTTSFKPPPMPPTISPPSPAPHVPVPAPVVEPPMPIISPPPHVPVPVPVEPPMPIISPPSPPPHVPVPVPVEPPMPIISPPSPPPYSPVPPPAGSPGSGGSPAPYSPAPAPVGSGSSQYPNIIGYTMFLASMLMGIGWF